MSISAYAGRRAVLATQHGKEAAIAPPLLATLGLQVLTAPGIDTDTLGTFTGEIPRAGNMQEAAIAKARLGMAATGLPLGLASEGSYGPHPHIPFVPGGVELLVLVDDERQIVVSEQLIEDRPVYEHALSAGIDELAHFIERIRFPDHAVIARAAKPRADGTMIHKGLRSRAELAQAVRECAAVSLDGQTLVQTDMRAHMNPTRMAALGRLASAFARRLATTCPACELPGFGQVGVETGLPCAECGEATSMVLRLIWGCVGCAHREGRERPDGLTHADAGRCPACNP
jgi:hypothetical protein